jgi:hypothetical protein
VRLDVRACAITCAVLWGAYVLLATWWVIVLDGASGELSALAPIYRGHSYSPVGSLIGLVWGVVDGLVVGAAGAWLYNRLAK